MQGDDVMSHVVLTYLKIEPNVYGTGCHVTSVLCVDPAGSLPDFVKNQIAASNSDSTEALISYLRKQKGLS